MHRLSLSPPPSNQSAPIFTGHFTGRVTPQGHFVFTRPDFASGEMINNLFLFLPHPPALPHLPSPSLSTSLSLSLCSSPFPLSGSSPLSLPHSLPLSLSPSVAAVSPQWSSVGPAALRPAEASGTLGVAVLRWKRRGRGSMTRRREREREVSCSLSFCLPVHLSVCLFHLLLHHHHPSGTS